MWKNALLVVFFVVVAGTHGVYLETDKTEDWIFYGGTGGFGIEYKIQEDKDVFFRPGVSFGTERGAHISATLGMDVTYGDYEGDIRVGVFQGNPYIGMGIRF